MPDTTDAYTHRIGRTGRAAKTGDAFTFMTKEDEPIVRSIERVLGEKIERCTIEGFNYKPAQSHHTKTARPQGEPKQQWKKKKKPMTWTNVSGLSHKKKPARKAAM